jgi:hypothetical protein
VPPQRSLTFRVKKQVNDLLRRLTGYQLVKEEELEALRAAAKAATPANPPPAGRRAGRPRSGAVPH